MDTARPVALIVLDGWGIAPPGRGNAIDLAETPTFDRIEAEYPRATLETCGRTVGLPDGQMGNSEVGHLNLGAGFIVDQELTRLGKAIGDGTFYDNEVLRGAVDHALARGSALHLMGLVGRGGVHAHTSHLLALVELARRADLQRVCVHAFTDGRDTAPDSGAAFLREIESALADLATGRIATVSGRYYAMDRDKRWERTSRAWSAMAFGAGPTAMSAAQAIERSYREGVTDEFVVPTVILDATGQPVGRLCDGDAVIVFNFRADRVRQLLMALTDPAFDEFETKRPEDLAVATMTQYYRGQRAPAAFRALDVAWPLARVISEHGLRQYHTAETEKYAHVTYFFNGGREEPFPGEDRHLVPSPKVATYDLQPEMSAEGVTDALVARIGTRADDFIIVNYANPDMVGHTGDVDAATRAVATVDVCLGRVLRALEAVGGAAVVTADHGNAEAMIDEATGGAHTAHTLHRVPIVVVGEAYRDGASRCARLRDGWLRDVAPTVLTMMRLAVPETMTGRSLLETPNGAPDRVDD